MELAIEPTVQQCISKFKAMQQSQSITQLRRRGEDMAQTPEELKWINRQLHEPTLQLRKGLKVNESDIMLTLKAGLESMRRKEKE